MSTRNMDRVLSLVLRYDLSLKSMTNMRSASLFLQAKRVVCSWKVLVLKGPRQRECCRRYPSVLQGLRRVDGYIDGPFLK